MKERYKREVLIDEGDLEAFCYLVASALAEEYPGMPFRVQLAPIDPESGLPMLAYQYGDWPDET